MKPVQRIRKTMDTYLQHALGGLALGILALGTSPLYAGDGDDGQSALHDPYWSHELANNAMDRAWAQSEQTSLKLSAQIQTRYILNARTNVPAGTVSSGFEARRTKLKASGRLDDPRIDYTLAMAFSRSTGVMSTEDVYARFKIDDHWMLKVGKFRPSVLREELISSKYQLGVERSLLTPTFGQFYNQGIALMYRSDKLRATLSAMDVSPTFAGDNIWEYILRAELMLSGKRSAVSDFTSFRDDEPATMIGAAIGYLEADLFNPVTPDSSTLNWSLDLTAEFGGANLFFSVVGAQIDTAGTHGVSRFGSLVQGGFFVTDQAELFARFTHGDDQTGKSLNLIEAGLNYYIHGHNAKFTIDAGYALDEVTSTFRSAGAGWRPDTVGQDGQFVLRAQMQLLF